MQPSSNLATNTVERLTSRLDDIIASAEKRKKGIEDYSSIRTAVDAGPIGSNLDIQKKYRIFFQMRFFPRQHYGAYFDMLDRRRTDKVLDFRSVVNELHQMTGSAHASFGSKLISIIDPSRAVYDVEVRKQINIRNPTGIEGAIEAYRKIEDHHAVAIKMPGFSILEAKWDLTFPEFKHFTRIKKLDLLMWLNRPTENSSTPRARRRQAMRAAQPPEC